jgi:hypothetical protein
MRVAGDATDMILACCTGVQHPMQSAAAAHALINGRATMYAQAYSHPVLQLMDVSTSVPDNGSGHSLLLLSKTLTCWFALTRLAAAEFVQLVGSEANDVATQDHKTTVSDWDV